MGLRRDGPQASGGNNMARIGLGSSRVWALIACSHTTADGEKSVGAREAERTTLGRR